MITCMSIWIVLQYWRLFHILISLIFHFFRNGSESKTLIFQTGQLLSTVMFSISFLMFYEWINDWESIIERFETKLDIRFHPKLKLQRIFIQELFTVHKSLLFLVFWRQFFSFFHQEGLYQFYESDRKYGPFHYIDEHFLRFLSNNPNFSLIFNLCLQYRKRR